MNDKKMALIYILEILKEHSDKNHCLTQADIIQKLESIYDVCLERKTISTHIQLLIDCGYNIINIPKKGYYLGNRDLNETQIKFLIDAVYSSKMITGEDAKEISKKLYSNLSKYEQKDFSYIHKSTDINRTSNIDLFKNIEIINEAIETNKKISFQYLQYDKNGNLTEVKNGKRYYVSPYYLVNNSSKYYLLCSFDYFDNHTIYRIDLMKDVQINNHDRRNIENVPTLGSNFSISKYINDHVYMFGGKVIHARVELLDNIAITYVKDWFGSNSTIMEINGKLYASIKSDDNAFFYWVLQYMKHIKVIEPDYMVKKVVSTLEETLKHYN